jgi:Xaa-Pro aminopeptidase
MRRRFFFIPMVVFLAACKPSGESEQSATYESELENPFSGPSPWPEIRKSRLTELLPEAMKAAGVDAWLILCRENHNDPIASHIGGENAGGTAVFLFSMVDGQLTSKVFSPIGEATALADLRIHGEVIPIERGESAMAAAAAYLQQVSPKVLAINSSATNELADGLSYTQRTQLEALLGPLKSRLVSSEELIYEWLSVKTSQEVDIMRKAAQITADWQLEAYRQVIPGVSTDADIARFLKAKMAALGVKDGWAADQNPNVNSGPDRGHSHPTDKVIMPGDVIQIDFGIRVFDQWVTDIQRFAYVLRPGETLAPDSVQHYWEHSRKGSRVALAAMKPGVSGYEVDKAQREYMAANGSEYVMWSTGHPVGYVAHDIGPSLGGAQVQGPPRASALKPLKVGQTFAFDGFFAWKLPNGQTKTMSVEEMAVITPNGAEYLIPPQEDLILIPSAATK